RRCGAVAVGCRYRRFRLRLGLERVMGVNEHLEPPVVRLRDLRVQLLEVALELRDMRSNGSFGMAWTHLTPVQVALVARVSRNGVEYLFVIGHAHLVVEDIRCRHRRPRARNTLKEQD